MGRPLPAELRELIESAPLAHLVTLNADGSPQVTIVWIGIEDDEIVSAHLFRQRKLRNIARDPRVAVSLEGSTMNDIGMRDYAVLYGHARITEGGAPELLQRLAYTYVGPGVTFPPMSRPAPRLHRADPRRTHCRTGPLGRGELDGQSLPGLCRPLGTTRRPVGRTRISLAVCAVFALALAGSVSVSSGASAQRVADSRRPLARAGGDRALWRSLVRRPRHERAQAQCRPLRGVFYAATDWLRLATKLAATAVAVRRVLRLHPADRR